MVRYALAMVAMGFALSGCAAGAGSTRPDAPGSAGPDAGAASAEVNVKVPIPPTRVQLLTETLNGLELSDPFRWLEDEKSPEVQAWMKAQDSYARDHLASLPDRQRLLQRFKELYYVESLSAPVKRGGRLFYTRTHQDQEKAIVYWRQGEQGEEKVLLDPNGWSADHTVSLGTWVPSWDGKKVVFAQRPNAADEATLYVLDVESGHLSSVDVIPGAKYASPSWNADSKGFMYEWLPTDPAISASERPGYCEVRYHVLGEDVAKDVQLHPRTGDAKTFLSGAISRDGQYQFVFIQRGWNENDILFKHVGQDKSWRTLVLGTNATYGVEVWKGKFYVFTDEGAPNKRVFVVDPKHPERKAWKELIPEDPASARESLTIVGGHLSVSSLRKAVSAVELYSLDGKKVRELELPGLGTASNLYGDEDDDEAFFSFSSFTMPPQVLRTSVATGKSTSWASVALPIDPSKYEVRQVSYPSKDGTPISMFIVAAKGVKLDGTNPTLLYGYGGFNVSVRSAYTSFIYPWLEAGGVYATPNLRGGGEYGKGWHDAGKLARKQNVFDDFTAAAEYLIREKWTKPALLGIRGGSNGGLLVGAAMTQHPELYGAVICAVPLLDMVRYPLYGSGRTWEPEYGDPQNAEDLKVLAAYSPYHHVTDGSDYPPLLMMSADHDDRVDPFHARKFVGLVQQATGGKSAAWLRIEANAGHGGADQVAKAIESSADQVAFLLTMLQENQALGNSK